jgi:hypothetical protein
MGGDSDPVAFDPSRYAGTSPARTPRCEMRSNFLWMDGRYYYPCQCDRGRPRLRRGLAWSGCGDRGRDG